jgi:DnaJ like chaperone protein
MNYRSNLGCLWLILLLLLIGGSPLLAGLLRIAAALMLTLLLAALAVGWWLRRHTIVRFASSQTEAHKRFVEILVALLVRLAEVDGPINSGEVAAIRRYFQDTLGYRGERLLWLRDLIKASRQNAEPVESLCARLRNTYGLQERFILLQVLARVAEADGRLGSVEIAFIERVAAQMGLGAFYSGTAGGFGSAGRQSDSRVGGPSEIESALSVLGLGPDSAAAEIKATWRKLSLENHPDRVAHLGPEFTSLAEERMRKINQAYTRLKEAGRVE